MKTQADYRKEAEDCVHLAHRWLQFADRAAHDHESIVNDRAPRNDKHP
jgi:hypothetical protein